MQGEAHLSTSHSISTAKSDLSEEETFINAQTWNMFPRFQLRPRPEIPLSEWMGGAFEVIKLDLRSSSKFLVDSIMFRHTK